MTPYKNLHGNSGVTGYEIGDDYIKVQFDYDAVYLYTIKSTGKKHIAKMKQLAREGNGLSTYISQYVKDNFESKN